MFSRDQFWSVFSRLASNENCKINGGRDFSRRTYLSFLSFVPYRSRANILAVWVCIDTVVRMGSITVSKDGGSERENRCSNYASFVPPRRHGTGSFFSLATRSRTDLVRVLCNAGAFVGDLFATTRWHTRLFVQKAAGGTGSFGTLGPTDCLPSCGRSALEVARVHGLVKRVLEATVDTYRAAVHNDNSKLELVANNRSYFNLFSVLIFYIIS